MEFNWPSIVGSVVFWEACKGIFLFSLNFIKEKKNLKKNDILEELAHLEKVMDELHSVTVIYFSSPNYGKSSEAQEILHKLEQFVKRFNSINRRLAKLRLFPISAEYIYYFRYNLGDEIKVIRKSPSLLPDPVLSSLSDAVWKLRDSIRDLRYDIRG